MSFKNKFLFTMTAYCALPNHGPDVIQPGFKPGTVVTPLALRGSALDRCATQVHTLDGVSIHPNTTKIQVSFLTQLPERKETTQGFHHYANGDFKTFIEFNGCDGRKLRMDQQHCSYSTILP